MSHLSQKLRARLSVTALEARVTPANVLVAGAAPGVPSVVTVRDVDTGEVLRAFDAYPGFNGPVSVALADLDGDGAAEVVTGAGAGGSPHVKVFDGATGNEVRSFFAYPTSFTGGVNVATGDVTGDGHPDIVTGTGAGGGTVVKVFDGAGGAELRSFDAYDPTFRSGSGSRRGT